MIRNITVSNYTTNPSVISAAGFASLDPDNVLFKHMVDSVAFSCELLLCFVTVMLQNLATLLITQQLVQQILESIIPYILYKRRRVNVERQHQVDRVEETRKDQKHCHISKDIRLQAEIERTKEEYVVSTSLCSCLF